MASTVEAKAAATAPPSSVFDIMRHLCATFAGTLAKWIPIFSRRSYQIKCTVEQLRCVEKSTRGKDLSPVTDMLWRNFYVEEFGASRADLVVENIKKLNVAFNWKELYEAKLEEVNKKENKAAERLKSRHQMEASRKQSRLVVVCTEAEVPSSSRTNKRSRSSNTLGLAVKMYPSEKKESLNMKKAKSYSSKKDMKTFKRSAIVYEDYAPNFDYHKTGNSRACLIA